MLRKLDCKIIYIDNGIAKGEDHQTKKSSEFMKLKVVIKK